MCLINNTVWPVFSVLALHAGATMPGIFFLYFFFILHTSLSFPSSTFSCLLPPSSHPQSTTQRGYGLPWEVNKVCIPSWGRTKLPHLPLIKAEYGIPPQRMSSTNSVYVPRMSPGLTAMVPQEIKPHNYHPHSEVLASSHAGFPAVSPESMSYY